jgi:predicted AAA+ superfamily ATPase
MVLHNILPNLQGHSPVYEISFQWKKDKNRRPLLVRGARQVGKTFLVNEFGNVTHE